MVRYAAHNGYDVGSNPTGYIILTMNIIINI